MTSLLKTTLEIPLSVIVEVCEQTAAFGYCKYGLHISQVINIWGLQKMYVCCGRVCC